MIFIPHWTDCISLSHWPLILAIGLTGQLVPAHRDHVRLVELQTPSVEAVEVKLSTLKLEETHAAQRTTSGRNYAFSAPPALPSSIEEARLPELTTVTKAVEIAFDIPRETYVESYVASQYASGNAKGTAANGNGSGPAVETLTYGQGEGCQPAPGYPRRAVRLGQEGTVTVCFDVACDGHVRAAKVSTPCPWPILNKAALCSVQNRWRFRRGCERRYKVALRFELKKQILK